MSNGVRRLSLIYYLGGFFPSNFNVTIELSAARPDDRVITVCDAVTSNSTTYEGPLLAILDICSMGTIATEMCNRLREQAITHRGVIAKQRQRT